MEREKITITKRKAKGVLADMIANMDEDSLAKTREKMEGITEDYCSYDVAKLLKEIGFDIEVGGMYVNKDNNFVHASIAPLKVKDYERVWDDQFIPTCTHQMAMKWLREVHKLFIVIEPEYFEAGRVIACDFSVWCGDNYKHHFKDNPTYEDAVEAALKYALENLI